MDKAAELEIYYAHTLKKTPTRFLSELCDNIVMGREKEGQVVAQLTVVVREGKAGLLEDFRDK